MPWFSARTDAPANPDATGSASEEAALVLAAQADPRAFVPLYQRYLKPVYRYCFVRLNNREAAEDATSQVFVKALANLHGFRGGSFVAWLFRITRNVVVDAYRARTSSVPLDSIPEEIDPSPTAQEQVELRIERQALQAALECLSEHQRTVVELTLAGWSGEAIGLALNKTPAAIKMERCRALKQVRDYIARDHSTENSDER